MLRTSRHPNLALRLVRSLLSADPFWAMTFPEQLERLYVEVARLRPVLELFIA
jgi:hypothetical protein